MNSLLQVYKYSWNFDDSQCGDDYKLYDYGYNHDFYDVGHDFTNDGNNDRDDIFSRLHVLLLLQYFLGR
jgi:hypothetical protein